MSIGDPTKYETLGIIGRGGMATVFVGRARGAGGFTRLVAIKRAHALIRGDGQLGASLRHEAELSARLQHPNVVRVIDVIEEAEDLVLVLDYVDGGSLSELLQRASDGNLLDVRARTRAVVRIALDVAAGLDAAHGTLDDAGRRLGIVHRDVSPSNVLVGADGIARLTDFGIAKALEGGSDLTETGELKGKIAYMAPEYIEHQRADAASDQFSLGIVIWEALAARRLFRGPTEIETMKRVVATRVPSIAEFEPLLAPLEPVLARALARSPSDRYANVRELAEALESASRAADLVATHGEVGVLVEKALGAELTERRRWGRTALGPEEPTSRVAAAPPATSGRDDRATGSIVRRASKPLLEPNALSPRRRRALLGASAVLMLGVALIAIFARRGPPPLASAEAEPDAGVEQAIDDPAATGSGEVLELDPAAPGSASSAVRARPGRPRAGGRRSTDPSLVPRKAPPNPYVH